MHLGNGAITPECAILTMAAAACGLAAAVWFDRKQVTSKKLVEAAAWGAVVLLAQMVNFPVLPYASGHLVGGVLLAAVLGPGIGAMTMVMVLAIQAVFLGDGGLAALGANSINMALIPAAMVYGARRRISVEGLIARQSIKFGLMAMLATVVAAILIVGEVALLRSDLQSLRLTSFAGEMIVSHLAIGASEGVLTALILLALERTDASFKWNHRAVVMGCSILVLLMALPLSSALPDGYEASVERSGWLAQSE